MNRITVNRLTASNLPEVSALCCAEIEKHSRQLSSGKYASTSDQRKQLTDTYLQYLEEWSRNHEIPMGCTAQEAQKHMENGHSAVSERLKKEPPAGLPILTILSLLWYLWQIFSWWMRRNRTA